MTRAPQNSLSAGLILPPERGRELGENNSSQTRSQGRTEPVLGSQKYTHPKPTGVRARPYPACLLGSSQMW